MVERTEPIRQDIEATRASMTDTMEQIEGQVRDKVDTTVQQARQALNLQHQVNERPWISLGTALTLGFVVGSLGGDDDHEPRRPAQPGQPMRYYQQPQHSSPEEQRRSPTHDYSSADGARGDHESHSQIAGAMSQIADPLREELSVMAVAAVRSAMRVLRESLQESIPQFDKEYRAVQHEREDDDHLPDLSEQRAQALGATGAAGRPSDGDFRARQG